MPQRRRLLSASILTVALIAVLPTVPAQNFTSTRVLTANQHACTDAQRYPFRDNSKYIFRELDIASGDVVVDIGAGDGWWSERMARRVGDKGKVHAADAVEMSAQIEVWFIRTGLSAI